MNIHYTLRWILEIVVHDLQFGKEADIKDIGDSDDNSGGVSGPVMPPLSTSPYPLQSPPQPPQPLLCVVECWSVVE